MTDALVAIRRSTALQRWRVGLVALGILLLLLGVVALQTEVSPSRYVGILIWFVGALILHDGIIAPLTFGVALLFRKAGRAIPRRRMGVILAILQAGIVVGGVVFVVVFPEVLKQDIGARNATILPLDYVRNLIVFFAVDVALTGAAIVGYLLLSTRRQKLRESSDQD